MDDVIGSVENVYIAKNEMSMLRVVLQNTYIHIHYQIEVSITTGEVWLDQSER